MAEYAKIDISSVSETTLSSMSLSAKQLYLKNCIDKLLIQLKDDLSFFSLLGIPQGTTLVSVKYSGYITSVYFGPFLYKLVDSNGNTYPFLYLCTSFSDYDKYKVYLKVSGGYSASYLKIDFPITQFITPVASLVVPDPVLPLTKYLEFMQKSSLYNSFVKNVQAEMVKKQSVTVIRDFIFSIFKDLKDGMVIFDYYQWQGEDSTGNYDMRMYKRFYIRVFGISAGSLVQKSFQIDHNLFSGIAGATLLDNGIIINNDGLTEKVGSGVNSYQRKGYIIHANNCNLETFIQKLQEDSAYTLETLEFPDFDSLNEKVNENKDYLTKDGKSIQQRFNEALTGYRSFYDSMKGVLGLTDSQVEFFAQRDAQRDIQGYIDTFNSTIATEATVSQGKVTEQQYQQSQANQSVEQAKAEAEAQKAKDDSAKAEAEAKIRDKEVKQKIIDYETKLHSLYNKYSNVSRSKLHLGLNQYVGDIQGTGWRAFYYQIPVSEVKNAE